MSTVIRRVVRLWSTSIVSDVNKWLDFAGFSSFAAERTKRYFERKVGDTEKNVAKPKIWLRLSV